MTPVHIPSDLWEDGSDVAISAWFYDEGAAVSAGAVIAELMVAKSSFELVAPASGALRLLVPAEQVVVKGQIVAEIG